MCGTWSRSSAVCRLAGARQPLRSTLRHFLHQLAIAPRLLSLLPPRPILSPPLLTLHHSSLLPYYTPQPLHPHVVARCDHQLSCGTRALHSYNVYLFRGGAARAPAPLHLLAARRVRTYVVRRRARPSTAVGRCGVATCATSRAAGRGLVLAGAGSSRWYGPAVFLPRARSGPLPRCCGVRAGRPSAATALRRFDGVRHLTCRRVGFLGLSLYVVCGEVLRRLRFCARYGAGSSTRARPRRFGAGFRTHDGPNGSFGYFTLRAGAHAGRTRWCRCCERRCCQLASLPVARNGAVLIHERIRAAGHTRSLNYVGRLLAVGCSRRHRRNHSLQPQLSSTGARRSAAISRRVQLERSAGTGCTERRKCRCRQCVGCAELELGHGATGYRVLRGTTSADRTTWSAVRRHELR